MSNPRRDTTFRIAVRKYDAFEHAIAKQWASFVAATGTTVTLEAVPMDLHPLHETLFEQQGLKNGTWDVGFICTDWSGEAEAGGFLRDLGAELQRNPPADYPHGWSPSLLRHQTFGPSVYGLPYHDGPECLIYRKDWFADPAEQAAFQRQHGRALKVPETWAEFHQIAQFFTRPDKKRWGTVFAAFPDGHNTVYDFCLQVWTRGGEVFGTDGKLRLDTQPARDGLAYYRAILNDQGAVHASSRDYDSVKTGLAFARGEVAMMVNWFGFAALGDADPNSPACGNTGVAPIPHAPDCRSASLNVYWLLGVGAGSPHADLAYRFVRHCASPEMDKLLTIEGAIGCRRSSWADAQVRARSPYYAGLDKLHDVARELPRVPHFAQLATMIDALVLDVINSSTPIADLCRTYQAKADTLVTSQHGAA